jgi:hypothetical protein
MAATLTKASEVLEVKVAEGIELSPTAALVAGVKPVAISATEGNNIEWGNWDRAFLLIEHTTAAEKECKVQAGDSPPALRKGLGEFNVKMAEKTLQIILIESGRHLTEGGLVKLKWTASTTGKVSVVYIKKG